MQWDHLNYKIETSLKSWHRQKISVDHKLTNFEDINRKQMKR